MSGSVGIFGSSFDPIHLGHLRVVDSVQHWMEFDEIRMVLTARPAHKARSIISDEDRWEMLCLACQDKAHLVPEDFEKNQSEVSFSINTLKYFKQNLSGASLSWIMGSDAFWGLWSWYRWEEVFGLCNFVVVDRPKYRKKLSESFQNFYEENLVKKIDTRSNGQILRLELPMLSMSSSEIRNLIGQRLPVSEFLPRVVSDYILEKQLYLGHFKG